MLTIEELVAQYKSGELGFAAMLDEVSKVHWAQKHITADGEIWWDEGSTGGDIDILWYEGAITSEERAAIFDRIL